MEFLFKRIWVKLVVLALCTFCCSKVGLATTVVMPSDEKMVVEARAIVRGRVLSVVSSFDEQRNNIYTYTTLKVLEVIKGQITTRKIVIKEMGGQVGDQIVKVYGTPEFLPGENVFVYLNTWPDGSLRVWQMFLGKFSIASDPRTGEQTVIRGSGGEGVDVIPESSADITNRMELSAYLEMVRNKLAANWERAQAIEATYYSNIPILARPPEFKGKLRSGDIELQYHLFSPPVRWFEPDGGQSVVFFTNPDGAPAGAVDDVAAALNAWSVVPGCSLRAVSGGSTTACTLQSGGPNAVVFNNCDGRWSGSPCQSVLALGGWRASSQTTVVNGTTFYRITQGFVSFNPFSCDFGNHCNVQEIATHELGHALGLHHSWDPSFGGSPTASDQAATMYYIAHFDGRCASLRQDDINGITFVYPGSSSQPPNTAGMYGPSSGTFFLRTSNSPGVADITFAYGPIGLGWIPLVGDWNGDGIDTAGLFNPTTGTFYLKNSHSGGPSDITFSYGPANAGWIPIVGDWNGDGIDTMGLFNPTSSTFYLKNSHSGGVADITFAYGPANAGWVPIAGDWNGDGIDTVGLFNPTTSTFYLKNSHSAGIADITFAYGPAGAGWLPVVGDWNGDRTDTVALFNPTTSTWFLKNSHSGGVADLTFVYGFTGGRPLAGRWN